MEVGIGKSLHKNDTNQKQICRTRGLQCYSPHASGIPIYININSHPAQKGSYTGSGLCDSNRAIEGWECPSSSTRSGPNLIDQAAGGETGDILEYLDAPEGYLNTTDPLKTEIPK